MFTKAAAATLTLNKKCLPKGGCVTVMGTDDYRINIEAHEFLKKVGCTISKKAITASEA